MEETNIFGSAEPTVSNPELKALEDERKQLEKYIKECGVDIDQVHDHYMEDLQCSSFSYNRAIKKLEKQRDSFKKKLEKINEKINKM